MCKSNMRCNKKLQNIINYIIGSCVLLFLRVYLKETNTSTKTVGVSGAVPLNESTANIAFKVPTGLTRRPDQTSSSASVITTATYEDTDHSFDLIDSQENASAAESVGSGKRKRKRTRKKKNNASTKDEVDNAALRFTSKIGPDLAVVKQPTAISGNPFKGHSKPNAHVR